MNDQNNISRALAVDERPIDTEDALSRFRSRVEREGATPVIAVPRRRISTRWLQALGAIAAVLIVASGLALSGAADSILKIFEPKSVVGVPVTSNDLSTLSQACAGLELEQCLGAYGTFTWTTAPEPREVSTLAAASNTVGFMVKTPSSLPASVTGQPRYGVINKSSATFTFSADATRQTAAKQNRTMPPLPANIDGSKLFITGGPAVVQIWGATANANPSDISGRIPTLVVGQAKSPVVSSDGVTVQELQTYLLSQPGISPQLAAAIRAISDPASTLPVPVPAELAVSHQITVQGVSGLFIGDNTGIASAIIWQKDGMMFEVIGSLTESQALAIANSMN
jgi:hypothetical protein